MPKYFNHICIALMSQSLQPISATPSFGLVPRIHVRIQINRMTMSTRTARISQTIVAPYLNIDTEQHGGSRKWARVLGTICKRHELPLEMNFELNKHVVLGISTY